MKLTRTTMGLAIAAGFSLGSVGLIGFAHTPSGRGLLAYLPAVGGCPLGSAASLSAEDRARARDEVLADFAGEESAASRVVFGFELGRTTQGEVQAWAADHHVACAEANHGTGTRCIDVPASALVGALRDVDDLLLSFDEAATLIAVDAARSDLSAEEASDLLRARTAQIEKTVGPVSEASADTTAAYLGAARLRRAGAEFRFADYRAEVAALNVGSSVRLRERHQTIGD